MPKTNSWLCVYAIAQLGKPYRMGTYGKSELSTQTTLKQKDFVATSNWYTNINYNKSVKTHDCSGLPLGALMCDTVDGEPTGNAPINHGSTSQYSYDCSPRQRALSMKTFPYIPGTLVFVKGDGDVKTHVGIYVGTFIDINGNIHKDAVIEAKGRDYGVVYSDVSAAKWGAWGQLRICEVDTTKDTIFDARTLNATGLLGNTSINLEVMNMKPFIATIPNGANPKLDYGALRDARVSGMMFFGGEYYDLIHIKKSSYANPYLTNQIQQCNSAGMPYAIYVNVRATTLIEADAECKTLYYLISRYSPQLGLWLSLELGSNVSVNDSIIEVYYKYIESWGISARCGFYVTEKQLSKITWGKFQDRFYLWLIKSMEVGKIDDELLDPEIFEVPE